MDNLDLHRFNGLEQYEAECLYRLYDEAGVSYLALCVKGITCIQTLEDSRNLNGKPHLEIRFPLTTITSVAKDTVLTIAESPATPDLSNYSNFYYLEHQPVKSAVLRVTDSNNGQLTLDITVAVSDPVFYDGTKPDAVIHITGTFTESDKKGSWDIF